LRSETLKGKLETTPQEYCALIELKAVVPELYCKVGAILGDGDEKTVETLGHYGRTFGIVSLVREEFIDLVELDELRSRLFNECLPLPMIYALQNPKTKKEILAAVSNADVTKEMFRRLVEVVLATDKVQELKDSINTMVKEERASLKYLKDSDAQQNLASLIGSIGKRL
jgi:geranylgeranyl pyrophosphate synthase